ncbi:DUF2470 domain-containing protein [Streptomonospora sp. S1-112]|uniref:DUF2470 domain-containing protein n=1 Tax=Streptomonospora mangrovi TaxID=2883123 RepID=A0A9X3NTF6_9ACTN|nr:DUF2470 domain-containing protein [Streptomonospora mangrovi]MDA0567684.1 DUF2470 domain-containing protein [Streptomonospora mangrovi]
MADYPGTRFSVRGAVDHAGRVLLWVAADHPLREALREGRQGDTGPVVGVELSALRRVGRTPTVRARLWCQGRAGAVPLRERRDAALAVWERDPDEELLAALPAPGPSPAEAAPLLVRVAPSTVVYHTYDAMGVVEGPAYLAARADPLARPAEDILARVNDRYRDELAAAAAALPGAPRGAAWLWELDAHGATVWVNPFSGADPVLVRVPWSAPAGAPCQLERAVFDFLAGGAERAGAAPAEAAAPAEGPAGRRGCTRRRRG